MAKAITRTLLGTVTERAEAVFGPQKLNDMRAELPNGAIWKEWETEWYRQADQFLEELKAEGLMRSYETLQVHVTSLRQIDNIGVL